MSQARYHAWQKRRTQAAECRHEIPKSHWLLRWEVQAIIAYRYKHLDEGYRPLTYMMLDENIVAVSPSSVYRVLKVAPRKEFQARGFGCQTGDITRPKARRGGFRATPKIS